LHWPTKRVIGRGAQGFVHLLEEKGSGELVVCKFCQVEDAQAAMGEVQILASLDHPHVIRYVGVWLGREQLRIFMEFAAGGSMNRRIEQQAALGDPFDTAVVVRWARQLASALEYVHEKRVLHRDLKTANILLTAADDVKLADFGVSTSIRTRSFANTIVGTPHCMAPEVLNATTDDFYREPADVWSLGICLYELLTLKRPFEGKTLAVMLKRITRAQYDERSLSRCPHPAALQELASHTSLLHPNPELRMGLPVLRARLGEVAASAVPVEGNARAVRSSGSSVRSSGSVLHAPACRSNLSYPLPSHSARDPLPSHSARESVPESDSSLTATPQSEIDLPR